MKIKSILILFIGLLTFSFVQAQTKSFKSGLSSMAANELITINTNSTVLIYKVDDQNKLRQVYFGDKLPSSSVSQVLFTKAEAYPAFGASYVHEPALRAVHSDGNTSTELIFKDVEQSNLSNNIEQTIITLKDTYLPFTVKLCFKAYQKENIIEQWTEISHTEKKPVTLFDFASSHLFFSGTSYFLTQFYGEWANEMNMKEMELTRGIKVLDSKLGVRSNQYDHACFYLSLDGKSQENTGSVIGATLAWPGSWRIAFDVDNLNQLHVISGINPFASQYILAPGELFKTPSLLYSYSSSGTGEVSRNFHRWAKQYGIYKGDKTRMTLMNNWEATYFDFNEEVLSGIIKDAANMGFELFLLDDGWFGNKYPRNNDDAGLGDWVVNKQKLPHGLGYLVEESHKNGIKFGIWLEPEMVNPKSELYDKHPDWVIGQPNRPLDPMRNQLILDLSNPEVRNYVYEIVDKTLRENPGIAYIKWDCNRFVTNSGSYYLPAEKQSHLWIEYVRGLFSVLERVREKYKDVSIMCCSGGGGRIDYGTLPYFDEFWISDNTDALDRIFIQWGTTQFFPAMALASHVSVTPNHITGRSVPLKFRFDVAMSGKLGMDLQPKDMSQEDIAFSKQAIKDYYSIREIVQFGDLYRLLSPYTNNRTAMMYVTENENKAVIFSYLLKKEIYGNTQALILKGLDPQKNYLLNELNKNPNGHSRLGDWENKTFSGEFLMKYGIRFPMYDEYESVVIVLEAT
ncbi:MAG: alpha-galactosidase [Candidatus Azobacteroides sp.]|nr:alpha-galactosidase [Candidatus Azobacteroides sp.]